MSLGQAVQGAGFLLQGLRLIRQPGLRRYVALPLALNGLLFALLLIVGISQFDTWLAELLPTGWTWLEWLLWPVFFVTLLVIAFYATTLLANIIAAPFNILLAAAVERHLTGARPLAGDGLGAMIKEALPALWQELIKLVYLAGWALPVLLLFVVPGVNLLLAPAVWLLFSAWMLAVAYCDYPMGNHGVRFAEQRAELRRQWPSTLGFGAAVLAVTAIPLVNFVVMPAAVAGATALYLDRLGKV